MKIVFIADSLRVGGAEILAFRLAKGFIKKGCSVHFIAIGEKGALIPILEETNITYEAFNCVDGVNVSIMRSLFYKIRNGQCDILISNHFRQLAHSFIPSFLAGVPHYHIEHDNLHYRTQKKYNIYLGISMLLINKLILISPTLYDWFKKKLPHASKKLALIPNGIDTQIFVPSSDMKLKFLEKHYNDMDYTVFGTCARLEPIKNISLLIDIFHNFHKKYSKSCLIIVGDGSCKSALQDKVKKYGLNDYVFFVGLQKNVIEWYQKMDYYLLTSDDEGLPLSVLEAMSCGVPVIARDVGDLSRLINSEDIGRIVKGTNIEDWMNCLETLPNSVAEYEKRSSAARLNVKKNYSLNTCIERYMKLFSNKPLEQ